MKNLGADFIATGEVVGQRPMSQYKTALENIEKETNLVNQIVRPLSARALPKTLAEKNKLINVKEFLDIIGRTRSRQIELAKKFKIEYPMPAGGCLLCDKNYSIKLKDLIEHKKLNKKQKNKQLTEAEIYSLDGFRHFRDNGRIILGRNHEQNLQLEKLNKSLKYNILFAEDKGPTAIYENKKDKSLVRELIIAFSTGNLKEREKFNTYRIIQD
jgi:tRNA U34 2-thiouridine synthase MnmA/TrmU